MNLRMKDLRNVVRSHADAVGSIKSAGTLLKSFREDFKGMMEELALMVNIKIDLDEIETEDQDFIGVIEGEFPAPSSDCLDFTFLKEIGYC